MKIHQVTTHYRQRLPHIQPVGATFFVTFRLQDSIPRVRLFQLKKAFEQEIAVINKENSPFKNDLIYEERKRFFGRYDALLDKINKGPLYLKQPEIAQIVTNELHRFNEDLYDLIAYCVMSNHVHVLIDTSIQIPGDFELSSWETLNFDPLSNIMKKIKGPSAMYANRMLNRSGKFWQRESYDHFLRSKQEIPRIVSYILQNPVKARLVEDWEQFPFTFLSKRARETWLVH